MTVRVRYAPSPTGLQHIGGVRSALFNYLFARKNDGRFLLRIEDTDRERFTPEAEQDVYDTLSWLGIDWDEGPDKGGEFGPYVQSERSELYAKYAEQLLAEGHAYLAYDTAEELQRSREDSDGKSGYDRRFRDMTPAQLEPYQAQGIQPVVRFRVPLEGKTELEDIVLGRMKWKNKDIVPDPVLLKSDGLPTYHLANVVDDHLMGITHIMRAQEWIPSAPLHIMLYDRFGWEPPHYCHLPMVVGTDGQKLSKRHGATRVLEFREKGYLPEAIINYLARLGWSYDDKRELFTLAELRELFDASKINKSPAVFDYKKLDWLNGHYIREKDQQEIYEMILPWVIEAGIVKSPPSSDQEARLREAIPLIHERLKHLSDAPLLVRFLFEEPDDFDVGEMIPKKLDAAETARLLEKSLPLIAQADTHSDEENEELFRAHAEALETKLGNVLMPIRVALSGSRVSPPLFGSIRLLGANEAARRAERALERLRSSAS